MIELFVLKNPTILMWDAPDAVNGPLLYPLLIGKRFYTTNHPLEKARLVYGSHSNQWMTNNKYFRYPTETELNNFSNEIALLLEKHKKAENN